MKEYYETSLYSTLEEIREAKILNIYANLYAEYVDDNEDHIYQHIQSNGLDVAPISEIEKYIFMLMKHIRSMMKGEVLWNYKMLSNYTIKIKM